jgi:DNA polymerase III gamma/tau subunit
LNSSFEVYLTAPSNTLFPSWQVGLVSDDKLVDLLDLALSADTVNTVKTLRDITETGVEPLALMSQLATIITDILAGTYTLTRERVRRKFFKRPTCKQHCHCLSTNSHYKLL